MRCMVSSSFCHRSLVHLLRANSRGLLRTCMQYESGLARVHQAPSGASPYPRTPHPVPSHHAPPRVSKCGRPQRTPRIPSTVQGNYPGYKPSATLHTGMFCTVCGTSVVCGFSGASVFDCLASCWFRLGSMDRHARPTTVYAVHDTCEEMHAAPMRLLGIVHSAQSSFVS